MQIVYSINSSIFKILFRRSKRIEMLLCLCVKLLERLKSVDWLMF